MFVFRTDSLILNNQRFLVKVSIAVKKHMTTGNLIKGNVSLGLAYNFRGVVYYIHDGMLSDIVLEKEMRALHLDPQTAEPTLSIA